MRIPQLRKQPLKQRRFSTFKLQGYFPKVVLLAVTLLISCGLLAEPIVEENVISWPDDGWYEVQTADDYSTVCEGGSSCEVVAGLYNVINHDTGDRWPALQVGPYVEGNVIRWLGNDWYQIQSSDDLLAICEGREHCPVNSGEYHVINLTTGFRWERIVVNVSDGTTTSPPVDPTNPRDPQPTARTLVLNLVGTGNMYLDTVPAASGLGDVVEAWCFDVDLVDLKTGQQLGTATDCLDPSLNGEKLSESGLGMIGTTYFVMPDGVLAIQGRTTVQPRNWPTREFTHITGGNSAGNAVLYGTGAYEGVSGTARLSGMVDLSGFDQTVGSPMTFDCLFVVELSQ